jgi:hypothetical protein
VLAGDDNGLDLLGGVIGRKLLGMGAGQGGGGTKADTGSAGGTRKQTGGRHI